MVRSLVTIGLGLVGRAHVGLRHDLHQRHARAVQIDIGHGRMLVVHRLAGVLLQMQPLDADLDVLELALAVRADRDGHRALADDRLLVLRDLVALRQVRIEVVLPVEDRLVVDLRPSARARCGSPACTHSSLMTGSMPGIAASTRLTLALGAAPKAVEAPENSFASDVTCACTSMPMITSQSPVAPGMKRFGSGVRVSMMVMEPASFDMGGGGKCDLPNSGSALLQTTARDASVPRQAGRQCQGIRTMTAC